MLVATFTDPEGPDPFGDYSATVTWNGKDVTTGSISYDSATGIFSVFSGDTLSQPGPLPFTVAIGHNGAPPGVATGAVTVSGAVSSARLAAPGNVTYGQKATFVATVTGYGPPSGTVTLYSGPVKPADVIGIGTLGMMNGQDVASIGVSGLSVNGSPYTITAVYSGDAINLGSTSNSVKQVVKPAPLSITADNKSKVFGQANPTLTVSIFGLVNGDTPSSLTMPPKVTTTATTTSPVGNYPITASGAVDANYTISYFAGKLTLINKDASTTTATVSSTNGAVGQTVTVIAHVTANAPGSGTPTGNVDFYDTSTSMDLGKLTLSGGSATLSTTMLSAGSHSITVKYSGDTSFLSSSTTAGTISIAQSIIVLDPTAGGALSLSGSATINMTGLVYVDSSSSSALFASGTATIKASLIEVHGGVSKSGGATFSPAPVTKAPVLADPLAALAAPSTCGLTNFGTYRLSGSSKGTINPGIYNGINVAGSAVLTMNPGLYIIEGGGFSVSGNSSISGTGVTIYNAGSKYPSSGGSYGAINLSGGSVFKLTAPASGPYAGVLFIQPAANTQSLSFSGNSVAGVSGTVYAPSAQLIESGSAHLGGTIIVDKLSLSGTSIANVAGLAAPAGTVAYSPAQVRADYGQSALSSDGSGQTIAIVDAYINPALYSALDAFDTQFGLTSSGPSLYKQYGAAASFLRVLGKDGRSTALPAFDPNGPGTDNWVVSTGTNGYDANGGYNLVSGSGTPLANRLVGDLVADQGPSTVYSGAKVAPLQDATLHAANWGSGSGQGVLNVFDVLPPVGTGNASRSLSQIESQGTAAIAVQSMPATGAGGTASSDVTILIFALLARQTTYQVAASTFQAATSPAGLRDNDLGRRSRHSRKRREIPAGLPSGLAPRSIVRERARRAPTGMPAARGHGCRFPFWTRLVTRPLRLGAGTVSITPPRFSVWR